jgi:hypothetical protein
MAVIQLSALRQRLLAFLVVGIGGIAASAVSFAMTVYEAAQPEVIPIVATGEPIDTGRWIVTIHGARTGATPPTGVEPLEPKKLLMVELELNNRSATSSYASSNLLTVDPPIPGLPDLTFYLERDKWIASPLNPDMPERLIAAWEWPATQPLPRELRLKIGSQIHKRRDNLYGAPGWFERDPVAVVVLPVAPEAAGTAQ